MIGVKRPMSKARRRAPKIRAEDLARVYRLGEALMLFRFTLEESLSPLPTVAGETPFAFEQNLIRTRFRELLRLMAQVRRIGDINRDIWPELLVVIRHYHGLFAGLIQAPVHLPPYGLDGLRATHCQALAWEQYEQACKWLAENLPNPLGRVLRLSLLVSKVRHPLPSDQVCEGQRAFDETYLRYELYPALEDLHEAIHSKTRMLDGVLPSNGIGIASLYDHIFKLHGDIKEVLDQRAEQPAPRKGRGGRPAFAKSSDPKEQLRCNIYMFIAAEKTRHPDIGEKQLPALLKKQHDFLDLFRRLDGEKLDTNFIHKALEWSKYQAKVAKTAC